MEQITNKLSISKKTLYIQFADKEHLLNECVDREITHLSLAVEFIHERCESSIEIIVLSYMSVFCHDSSFCAAFHKDLPHYPAAYGQWINFRQTFRERCTADFLNGVTEGDFLPGQNYELISTMLTDQLNNLKTEYQRAMILTIIRGVCTDNGNKKIDTLMESKYRE